MEASSETTSSCALAYNHARGLSARVARHLLAHHAAALAATFFIDRRRRKAEGAEPTDAGAEPAIPSGGTGSDE